MRNIAIFRGRVFLGFFYLVRILARLSYIRIISTTSNMSPMKYSHRSSDPPFSSLPSIWEPHRHANEPDSAKFAYKNIKKVPLNRNVLIFSIFSSKGNAFHVLLWYYLRDVTADILNSIIVINSNFSWLIFYYFLLFVINLCFFNFLQNISLLIHIIYSLFLIWNILDTTLPFYHLISEPRTCAG